MYHQKFFNHFLALSISVGIMLNPVSFDDEFGHMLAYSKNLLKWFVDNSQELYGRNFVTYNVHSLIHLHQDVEHFHLGLQEMSAFPFENFMQNIKRMVRKGQSPLSQIVRRISEFELSSLSGKSKKVKTKFSSKTGDSWFLSSNNKVCKIINIEGDRIMVDTLSFDSTSSYFTEPFDSKLINICTLHRNARFQRKFLRKEDFVKNLFQSSSLMLTQSFYLYIMKFFLNCIFIIFLTLSRLLVCLYNGSWLDQF